MGTMHFTLRTGTDCVSLKCNWKFGRCTVYTVQIKYQINESGSVNDAQIQTIWKYSWKCWWCTGADWVSTK